MHSLFDQYVNGTMDMVVDSPVEGQKHVPIVDLRLL